MKKRYLLAAILMLAISPASWAIPYISGEDNTAAAASELPEAHQEAILQMPAYYGGGGSRVHFLWGMTFAYSHGQTKTAEKVTKDGGFSFIYEMGAKIDLALRNQRHSGTLGISAAYYGYKVGSGAMALLAFPVSFTCFGQERGNKGRRLYWDAGLIPGYLIVANDIKDLAGTTFNRYYVDPSVGVGFDVPFVLVDRRSHSELASGRIRVGISVTCTFPDALKGPDTQRGLIYGLKYQYVFGQ